MNENNPFKVLLYFDGSVHSFFAVVYAANLFNIIPNMYLTLLHVHENVEVSRQDDYNLMDICSTDPKSNWAKNLLEKVALHHPSQYTKIIAKTNEIFSEKVPNIDQQLISAKPKISDTVETIIDYTTKKDFLLFIMGTRGLTSLKGSIYGSLSHSMLNKCDIPLLLIKNLSQEFINNFFSSPTEKYTSIKSDRLYLVKTM